MKSLPEYEEIEEFIASRDEAASAAELHGMLSGMLCATPELEAYACLRLIFENEENPLDRGDAAVLAALCESVRKGLISTDFSFELLLPDDDADLSERAHALSEWCQGFLYGLGAQAASNAWCGESEQVLRYLAEIAQLDSNVAGEEDETALMELSEFVRMGVQLIRIETRSTAPDPFRIH